MKRNYDVNKVIDSTGEVLEYWTPSKFQLLNTEAVVTNRIEKYIYPYPPQVLTEDKDDLGNSYYYCYVTK